MWTYKKAHISSQCTQKKSKTLQLFGRKEFKRTKLVNSTEHKLCKYISLICVGFYKYLHKVGLHLLTISTGNDWSAPCGQKKAHDFEGASSLDAIQCHRFLGNRHHKHNSEQSYHFERCPKRPGLLESLVRRLDGWRAKLLLPTATRI